MRPLSAADAVAPAWEHTRSHLLKDFSLRRYMKLASVGFLASLGAGFNFNSNMNMHHGHAAGLHNHISAMMTAVTYAVLIPILLVMVLIGLILFYIGSRMQFVLLETVAMKTSLIAPVWARYGRRTWRWIGLKVMLFIVAFLLMLPVLLPIFLTAIKSGSHMNKGAMLVSFLGAFSLMFVLAIFLMAVYYLLQDFALPVIALEDASITTSLGRLKTVFGQEPGAVLLYLLLRFLLGLVFSIAIFMVWGILLLISAIPFAIVGVVLYLPLHKAGAGGMVVMVCGFIVLGLIGFAWGLGTLIALAGYKETFFEAYALYFYGGRYQLLGDILQPPPVVAAPAHETPPPPFKPPMLEPLG